MGKGFVYTFFFLSYFAGAVALIGAAGFLLPARPKRQRLASILLASGTALGGVAMCCALTVAAFLNM